MDLSISEVADRLGVNHTTVWRWVQDDAFPNAYQLNPKKSGSPYRIPEEDVIALEEERRGRQTNNSQADTQTD